MKKIILLIILIFAFSVNVSAQQSVYSELYDSSGLNEASQQLTEQAKEFFEKNEIDLADSKWYEKLNNINVFATVADLLKNGITEVLRGAAEILGIVLLAAVAGCFADERSGTGETMGYIFSALISAVIIKNVIVLIKTAAAAIKGTATFMLAAVPVFSGIAVLGGSAVSAKVSSGLILAAAQAITYAAAFVVVPLMSAYMAVGICSGVSPLLKKNEIAETVKKAAMWVLTLVFTLFLGILSVQTSVASAADTVGVRTAKFLVGSLVPVAGSALGEAVTTVSGSVSFLKNSVGIYAVIAIAVTLLPIVAELVLWRICINLSSAVTGMFSLPKTESVLKSVDAVLALLIGITLFVGAVFIISLAIVIKAGGG